MENNVLLKNGQNGDEASILELLNHKGAIYRINGIINSVRHKMSCKKIVDRIKSLCEDNISIDGYFVSEFAFAALDLLGESHYDGTNSKINNLISCKLEF